MIDGFDCYRTYLAVKTHFTRDSYDIFKNKYTRSSLDTFEKRRDKSFFYGVGRMFHDINELRDFFVANVLDNEGVWIGDCRDKSAYATYLQWKGRQNNLTYNFQNDLTKILDYCDLKGIDPKNVFISTSDQLPFILTMLKRGDISLETVSILDAVIGLVNMWDKYLLMNMLYQPIRLRVKKYTPFINFDWDKYRTLTKKNLPFLFFDVVDNENNTEQNV